MCDLTAWTLNETTLFCWLVWWCVWWRYLCLPGRTWCKDSYFVRVNNPVNYLSNAVWCRDIGCARINEGCRHSITILQAIGVSLCSNANQTQSMWCGSSITSNKALKRPRRDRKSCSTNEPGFRTLDRVWYVFDKIQHFQFKNDKSAQEISRFNFTTIKRMSRQFENTWGSLGDLVALVLYWWRESDAILWKPVKKSDFRRALRPSRIDFVFRVTPTSAKSSEK